MSQIYLGCYATSSSSMFLPATWAHSSPRGDDDKKERVSFFAKDCSFLFCQCIDSNFSINSFGSAFY